MTNPVLPVLLPPNPAPGPDEPLPVALQPLEVRARLLTEARTALAAEVTELQDQIERLRRQHMPRIRELVARAANHTNTLQAMVAERRECFVKPKTVVLHGIKCGFEKQKGALHIQDADRTCELVLKHMPERYEELVIISPKPRKSALALLPSTDLRRLGITIVDATDQVVVRPVDTEVDKIVNALLASAVETATEAL